MNTLTTKDLKAMEVVKKPAYDFFGSGWAISASPADYKDDNAIEPVSRFGISGLGGVRTSRRAEGFGGLGAVRTSRRSEGFGGLGFLDTQILGIPLWALAGGAAALFVLPKLLKK